MLVLLVLTKVFIRYASIRVRIKEFPFLSTLAYACVLFGCVKTELQQAQGKVLWSTNDNVCT